MPITTIKTKEWLISYKERSIILIVEFFDKKTCIIHKLKKKNSLKFELFINSTENCNRCLYNMSRPL